MGFKAQDNARKRLQIGERWHGNHALWMDMVNNRPQDAPLLRKAASVAVNNDHTASRDWLGATVNAQIYKRMVWKSDMETRGKPDTYFSRLVALIFGKATEYGDCDDFACTFLEAMLLWGVDPKYLVFIQVLTKQGQKDQYYGRSESAANHNIGGVLLPDGDILIIDSNEARNATRMKIKDYPIKLRLSQTDYKVYMVHFLDWSHERWHYASMA